ncbi:hypothetical protein [Usitatibacter palustris]|uniref:Lipoprotein n=1 Tax=Usitatibacter palustris TaxID=2732487 RepID=A0A6M4H7U2_9PROT|nr:hypothetical protein [Usitatibacter palustris]QJR15719.1 hypothetical protein DSM104440_02545 [Usitatibacter palustris]
MFMRVVVGIGVVVGLIACTVVPLNNVENAALVTASGKTPTATAVRGAIVQAGAGLGWVMTDVKPGVLQATLNLRTHSAVVEIPYTPTSFSIVYKSSTNLDAGNGQIHKNYNGWIQNLQRDIKARVSAL